MSAASPPKYETREAWLLAGIAALRPVFEAVGETLPTVRVSVGWPAGRGRNGTVIGQCWPAAASIDQVAQLFVSPVLDDPERVLDVLAHELVHAIDDCQSGHRGRFAKVARSIGLRGKVTATVAGESLKPVLAQVATDLGAYPHAALAAAARGADEPKKQNTRMLKVGCPDGSGYVVRMTRKWIEELGTPSCPCHDRQMREAAAS